MFWVDEGIDHLWNELVLFSDLKNCARILVSPAVVSCGEHCEELAAGEAFEPVHHTFVSSKDVFCFIILQKVLHAIWSKLDDVAGSVRVADEVWLNTKLTVTVSWVRPQNVND